MGIKISELPQASQLTSDDVVPIVQSGDTKKISVGNVISNSHNSSTAGTYSSDYINNNFNKVNVQTSQTTSTTDTYSCNYIDNKIKNEYNTNTTEGYSSNYINNKIEELTTYSTTEKRIGTWIDGKPLYRITIVLPNGTGQTTQKNYTLSDYGVTNVDEIFMVHPSYYRNIGQNIPFNFYDGSTYELFVSPTTLSVLVTYSPIANNRMVITLEYTKTTD
jgi:hypothetical protein